jgi:hypothetical protein
MDEKSRRMHTMSVKENLLTEGDENTSRLRGLSNLSGLVGAGPNKTLRLRTSEHRASYDPTYTPTYNVGDSGSSTCSFIYK